MNDLLEKILRAREAVKELIRELLNSDHEKIVTALKKIAEQDRLVKANLIERFTSLPICVEAKVLALSGSVLNYVLSSALRDVAKEATGRDELDFKMRGLVLSTFVEMSETFLTVLRLEDVRNMTIDEISEIAVHVLVEKVCKH